MLTESPEEVLLQIMNRACSRPGGEYKDEMSLMCHPARPPSPPFVLSQIPPAVIVGNDAYFYLDNELYAFHQSSEGFWQLRKSLSKCTGCFGDHSYASSKCWGVLCQCCGGTGWELGELDFCAGNTLPDDLAICVTTDSPRAALMHLLETDLALLDPIRIDEGLEISQALVRGQRAKLEIITPASRYLALLEQDMPGEWCLAAFVELCQVCGGHGTSPILEHFPCPACGGLKWGTAGALRYCRNDAPGWYTLQD